MTINVILNLFRDKLYLISFRNLLKVGKNIHKHQ